MRELKIVYASISVMIMRNIRSVTNRIHDRTGVICLFPFGNLEAYRPW
jgi:hypothetical protein